MHASKLVLDRLEAWEPETRFQKESTFHDSMAEYLKRTLPSTGYQIKTEGKLQIDIAVGNQVGIELKHSPSANEIDRLNGQIDRYISGFDTVIVAVFGDVHSRWEHMIDSYPSVHFMQFWKGGNSYSEPAQKSRSSQTHPAFEGWM
ncbi:hypothetical protein [Halovenus marina]|uniref:hypothetical protein n=1 Tax=Halovenus marina TaxID=3396621 RepID=UPI003F557104